MLDIDEVKFTNRIRQALNEGARLTGDHGTRIAERLRAARERAIERRRIAHEPAYAGLHGSASRLSGASAGTLESAGGAGGFSLRLLLATALLGVGLFAIYSVQQAERAAEVEELDAQLLTSDLPLDAYLDRGFEAWLKKVSAN